MSDTEKAPAQDVDEEHAFAEELDEEVQDDAIIGIYLRRSLVVLAAAAAVAGVLYFVLTRAEKAPEVAGIERTAPVEVAPAEVEYPRVRFTDTTAAAGIDFVHENGAEGEKLLPETMGSGAAFFDFDGDGDQDLLLLNGTTWPHAARRSDAKSVLYRNDGRGHFTDATAEAGLVLRAYATGAAVGDFDNDGWVDLFVAAVGKNRLFRNREGRFEERTEAAGVGGADDAWSTSAAFADLDNDGDLDLFVCNYVVWSPQIDRQVDYRLTGVGRAYGPPVNYEGTFSYLYQNRGDGTFEDVSASSGVEVTNPATGAPAGKALGVAPVDVDEDGFVDLMVANDTVGNFFFHNRSAGSPGAIVFEESGELYGLAYGRNGEATGAMGIDADRLLNDGALGFAIGNFANEMTSLYVSQDDPTLYADEAITLGIGAPSRTLLSFGVFYFDYDLDSRLDILQANGHLEGEISKVDPSQSYEQPPQLFWNAGSQAARPFVVVDLATAGDLGRPLVGRGGGYADVDGDGDLDVLLTQTGRAPVLLRNDQDLGHHYLRLRLVDPKLRRDAIGARAELSAGGVTQRRRLVPTRGYQSQSEMVLTFGLGETDHVDSLRIVWPDGTVQDVVPDGVDRLLVVEKEG